MIELQKLTPSAAAFFREKTPADSEVLLTLKSDLSGDGVHRDIFIVLTKEKLLVADGSVIVEKQGGERVERFSCANYDEYDLSKLKDPKVELFYRRGVSSAITTARRPKSSLSPSPASMISTYSAARLRT